MPRHRTATRKGLFAAAGVVALGGLVAVLLPQANAEQSAQDSVSAMDALTSLRQERIPGTAWATDPRTNRMIITADATVTGDTWNELEGAVDAVGGQARLRRSE